MSKVALPMVGIFDTTLGRLVGISPEGATDVTTVATVETNLVTGGVGFYGPNGELCGFTPAKWFAPSGDVTGVADAAAILPYALAGWDIHLASGDFYFNDTLVRGFRRNADGTLALSNWNVTAQIGDLVGSGSNKTTMRFVDTSKPCVEMWCRPELAYRTAAKWLNPVSGASVINVDRATAWTGGKTSGLTIRGYAPSNIGDLPTTLPASSWVDQTPNHIGLLVWGACADHKTSDAIIKYCGVGKVLHDCTGMSFESVRTENCSVGEAHAIQWDGNVYNNCTFNHCRVGTSFVWRGLYESSAYTAFGREASGTYAPTPTGPTGQSNIYLGVRWYYCAQAAIAVSDDPGYLGSDGALWSNKFQSCYFESNAIDLVAPQNNVGGSWVFEDSFFESQNNPMAEAVRTSQWFRDRMGCSQGTINKRFCRFTRWYGGVTTDGSLLQFIRCQINKSDYGQVNGDAWQVEFDRCSFPGGIGSTSGAIVTALGETRGLVKIADNVWWSPRTPISSGQGNDKWRVHAGFVSQNGGPFMSAVAGAALPTAAVNLRGELYGVTGGAGVADTVSVCQKSAADTYSWKLLSTG